MGGAGHPPPGPPPRCPPFPALEHQNFFGLDEVLGPVAVSLRREEKEGSGGGTVHSYRIIVRTTQVGTGAGSQRALRPGKPVWILSAPYVPSSAPDPPRQHLGGSAAAGAPAGPIPEEASGTRGAAAEPNMPAPGLGLTEGATHAAHTGRASGEWPVPPSQPYSQAWPEPSLLSSQLPSPDPDPGLAGDPGRAAFSERAAEVKQSLASQSKICRPAASTFPGAC